MRKNKIHKLALVIILSLSVLAVRGQVNQNNPSQYVAIAEGNIKIDNTVNDQKMRLTDGRGHRGYNRFWENKSLFNVVIIEKV